MFCASHAAYLSPAVTLTLSQQPSGQGQRPSLLCCLGGTRPPYPASTPRAQLLNPQGKTQRKITAYNIYFHTTFHTISTIHNGFLFHFTLSPSLWRWTRLLNNLNAAAAYRKKCVETDDALHTATKPDCLCPRQFGACFTAGAAATSSSGGPRRFTFQNIGKSEKLSNFYSRIYDTRSLVTS